MLIDILKAMYFSFRRLQTDFLHYFIPPYINVHKLMPRNLKNPMIKIISVLYTFKLQLVKIYIR